jgi:hypothetical protein
MVKLSLLFGAALAQDVFLGQDNKALTAADLTRAKKPKASALVGESPEEIATKLNSVLRSAGGASKSCDDHSVDELNDIMKLLLEVSDEKLQEIYVQNKDLRARRLMSEQDSSDDKTTRHGKCFQIGELWAHHLAESVKKTLAEKVPELPVFDTTNTDPKYTALASCQSGHTMVTGGGGASSHEWPNWPEQLHYKAKGHGAYPFWWGGGSDDGTADLEVWWSEKYGAEKFYHSKCTGQSLKMVGVPCTHLMFAKDTNQGQAYLYTDSYCCKSQASSSAGSGPTEILYPSQGNFMDIFTYQGDVDFKGVNYKGKAKYYTYKLPFTEPIRDFWYFTDMDGKPVQQGEGGTGPTDQGYPQSIGHTVWHDYEPSSLDSSAIDDSVFAIPAHCKTTTATCAMP